MHILERLDTLGGVFSCSFDKRQADSLAYEELSRAVSIEWNAGGIHINQARLSAHPTCVQLNQCSHPQHHTVALPAGGFLETPAAVRLDLGNGYFNQNLIRRQDI